MKGGIIMLNIDKELLKKAKQAQSVEELIELAKEEDFELSEEYAKGIFQMLNSKAGELEDEELDNVSGGSCAPKPQPYSCPNCGFGEYELEHTPPTQIPKIFKVCKRCGDKKVFYDGRRYHH